MHVCGGREKEREERGGQRITCWVWFFMWIPGLELRSSGLAGSHLARLLLAFCHLKCITKVNKYHSHWHKDVVGKCLHLGPDDMAQWLMVLAAQPDDPSLVSRTHMVEVENQVPQVVL